MNEQLLEEAKEAISKLFGDRSVSVSKAIENMEELSSDIDTNLTALRADLAAQDDEV